jgi:hypothetical protein
MTRMLNSRGLAVVEVAAADDATARPGNPANPASGCASSWTCARSPARSAAGGRPRPADQPWSGSWSGARTARFADRWAGWQAWGCDVDATGTDIPRPLADPALVPGWAAEPKLWTGFRSVGCPLRAWLRALRCEGPWTSGGVG